MQEIWLCRFDLNDDVVVEGPAGAHIIGGFCVQRPDDDDHDVVISKGVAMMSALPSCEGYGAVLKHFAPRLARQWLCRIDTIVWSEYQSDGSVVSLQARWSVLNSETGNVVVDVAPIAMTWFLTPEQSQRRFVLANGAPGQQLLHSIACHTKQSIDLVA